VVEEQDVEDHRHEADGRGCQRPAARQLAFAQFEQGVGDEPGEQGDDERRHDDAAGIRTGLTCSALVLPCGDQYPRTGHNWADCHHDGNPLVESGHLHVEQDVGRHH